MTSVCLRMVDVKHYPVLLHALQPLRMLNLGSGQ